MARRIALTAVAILSGQAVAACVISAFILLLALAVHLQQKPYFSEGHQTITLDADGKRVYKHADEDHSADKLTTPDKLETLCIGTLVAVYSLGIVCAGLEPEDGSTAATVLSVVLVLVLISPIVGVVYLQRQAGESWSNLAQAFCPDLKSICKRKDKDGVYAYTPEQESKQLEEEEEGP